MTSAELSPERKNQLSHRAQALKKTPRSTFLERCE
jgi:inosine/xanthosine triphosphate pyrophosphatase family protein